VYASYSRGFQPQFGTLVFIGTDSFKPEESEQYEVGVKTDFLKGRFTSTLAYFHLTKENVLTEVSGDPLRSIPVGEQRSQGIELDLNAHLLPGWDLIASYAFTDAEITKDNTFPEGNKLNNVPEHAGSLWTTYEIQQSALRGLSFGVGVFVASNREGDLANTFEIPGYTRADAAIFYDAELFRAALNFMNLFDEDYFEGAQFRESILPGASFTVLGSIEVKF
jgi:iron complex outermembrane receptor protein